MFKKYISKISNSIGPVSYLHKISHHRKLSSDEHSDESPIDLLEESETLETAQIILSTAIAELRNTLFFYPLVLNF